MGVPLMELQTPLDATTLNQVSCDKEPVLKGMAKLVAERDDCVIGVPTFEYEIPSVEDCHWMFPMLPAARVKFKLFP